MTKLKTAVSILLLGGLSAFFLYSTFAKKDFSVTAVFMPPQIEAAEEASAQLAVTLLQEDKVFAYSARVAVVLQPEEGEQMLLEGSVVAGQGRIAIPPQTKSGKIIAQVEVEGKTAQAGLVVEAQAARALDIDEDEQPALFDGKPGLGFAVFAIDRFENTSASADGQLAAFSISDGCALRFASATLRNGAVENAAMPLKSPVTCLMEVKVPGLISLQHAIPFISMPTVSSAEKVESGGTLLPTAEGTAAAEELVAQDMPAQAQGNPLLMQAVKAYRERHHAEAKAILNRLMAADPGNSQYWLLAGENEFTLGNYQSSHDLLARFLAYFPAHAEASYFLGEALLKIDARNAAKAIELWTPLTKGSDKRLAAYIEKRLAALAMESTAGETFETDYCIITHQGGQDSSAGKRDFQRQLTAFTNTIYRALSQDFGQQLAAKIPLVLYNHEEYQRFTGFFHFNTAGFFDGEKVRIDDALELNPRVQETLAHEFTHAFLASVVGRPFATWFNEGLAQREAAKTTGAAELSRDAYAKLLSGGQPSYLPFSALEAGFNSLNQRQAELAYLQSRAFIAYLESKFGFARIGSVLLELRNGARISAALEGVFFLPFAKLEQGYRDFLLEKAK